MVLSFHPNIVAHQNILCAGRLPGKAEEKAIILADAILLPQGCSETLYRLCRKHCPHVFPNYDCRFDFPGKVGQTILFQKTETAVPETCVFPSVDAFRKEAVEKGLPQYPIVFKSNWGGEGESVFLVESDAGLERCLVWATGREKSGHFGFLIQEFVPSGSRVLRVVIIGRRLYSYWRFGEEGSSFLANLRAGGVVDHAFAPELQEKAKRAVEQFCHKTKIDLAGFDLIFPLADRDPTPLFLEINYFFGRRGLGGSFKYYELLDAAVNDWLAERGLWI
jgi:ribosomal protein S6--L-glutamate ligase